MHEEGKGPLNRVRDMVMSNSRAVFKNEHFIRIDLQTLTDLLKLHQLSIAEIEVLAAVSKWVNWRIEQAGMPTTPGNKRAAFAPIKRLIRFTDMLPDEVGLQREVINESRLTHACAPFLAYRSEISRRSKICLNPTSCCRCSCICSTRRDRWRSNTRVRASSMSRFLNCQPLFYRNILIDESFSTQICLQCAWQSRSD